MTGIDVMVAAIKEQVLSRASSLITGRHGHHQAHLAPSLSARQAALYNSQITRKTIMLGEGKKRHC